MKTTPLPSMRRTGRFCLQYDATKLKGNIYCIGIVSVQSGFPIDSLEFFPSFRLPRIASFSLFLVVESCFQGWGAWWIPPDQHKELLWSFFAQNASMLQKIITRWRKSTDSSISHLAIIFLLYPWLGRRTCIKKECIRKHQGLKHFDGNSSNIFHTPPIYFHVTSMSSSP